MRRDSVANSFDADIQKQDLLMKSPLFSICIPTKNRGAYIENCVRAALAQDFDDFEVVISDNNSTDQTEEIVVGIQSDKVKYTRSSVDLGVSENFDRAVLESNGRYFILIADDELLTPVALSTVEDAFCKIQTDIVRFSCGASYTYPGIEEVGNTLKIDPFTGGTWRISSSDALRSVFSLDIFVGNKDVGHKDFLRYAARGVPLGARTATKRTLFDKIYRRVGFFHAPEPMYSSAIYLLNEVEDVIVCDRHLCVGSVLPSMKSRGGAFLKNPDDGWDRESRNDLYKDFDGPTSIRSTMCSYQTSGILAAQKYLSPDLDVYSLNMEAYCWRMLRELYILRVEGVDIGQDLCLLKDFMKKENVRDDFVYRFDPRRKFKPQFLAYSFGKFIKNWSRERNVDIQVWNQSFDGKNHHFSNVIECLEQYEEIASTLTNRRYADQLLQHFYPQAQQIQ